MFKALWCWLTRGHSFAFVRNVYGDEINFNSGKRAVWRCGHCGWQQNRRELVKLTDLEVIIRNRYTDGHQPRSERPWSGQAARKLQSELARRLESRKQVE